MASAAIRKREWKRTRSTKGCVTCKRRRKKCDETKPRCCRCTAFGAICEGYSTRSSGAEPTPLIIFDHQTKGIDTVQPSSELSFRDQREGSYYLAFLEEIVPELCNMLNTNVWSKIVLQACHSKPFIREAVVAFAALRTSLITVEVDTSHYDFALLLYGRAIRDMQNSLSSKECDIRNALIGCLLLFGFEVLQDNQKAASQIGNSGYQLLQDWLRRETPVNMRGNVMSSPKPDIIEDDLIYAFYRMDLQMMTSVGSRPLEIHRLGQFDGEFWMNRMPAAFKDFDEAYRYRILVSRRCMHFVQFTGAISKDSFKHRDQHATASQRTQRKCHETGTTGPPFQSRREGDSDDIRASFFRAQSTRYAEEERRWDAAFKPLYLAKQIIPPEIALLNMMSTMERVCFNATATEAWDPENWLPEFREIIALSRVVLASTTESPSIEKVLSVDTGVVRILCILLNICPDRAIVREALGILRTLKRNEGGWDSELVAGIASWIMEVEDGEGVHNAVKVKTIALSPRSRTATIECLKRVGKDETVTLERKTIFWGVGCVQDPFKHSGFVAVERYLQCQCLCPLESHW